MSKYYVVQHGFGVYGEGDTEGAAIDSAKFNGCQFSEALRITGTRYSGTCNALMTENGELAHGQIVIMTEDQYSEYRK